LTTATEPVFETADFTVHTLAPGIHAAIAKKFSGAVSNAGIIDLGDRTLIFDTFMCVPAARDLQQAALKLTGRPATYVFNSHPHPDHIYGNIAFGDEAVILSSAATRADLLTRGAQTLEQQRQEISAGLRMVQAQAAAAADEAQRMMAQGAMGWFQKVLAGLPAVDELRYPAITFAKELTLHGPARSVRLMTLGGGHSPSDSILWLPAARIAFTADVVVSGTHPVMDDGEPREWLRNLDAVDALGAGMIVPGHGRVGGNDATAPVRQYMTDILAVAGEAVRHGVTPESAGEVPVPEAYKALPFPEVFTKNMAALLRRMG
jgi:cyclase